MRQVTIIVMLGFELLCHTFSLLCKVKTLCCSTIQEKSMCFFKKNILEKLRNILPNTSGKTELTCNIDVDD